MSVFKEKTIGCLLVAGIAITVIFGGLSLIFSMGGVFRGTYTREPVTNRITDAGTLNLVPTTLGLAGFGIVMIAVVLIYALWLSKNENKGPRAELTRARVIARYAFDEGHIMITEPYQIEVAENPRFYVKLEVAPGQFNEYECAESLFWSVAEGSFGDGVAEGKWLGSFTTYRG